MSESTKQVFLKRIYTTNNRTRINLHDNNLFLLTIAVDPRYRLYFFPANLKQKVVGLLKSEVKIHSCREIGQSQVLTFFRTKGQVPLVPPNKPKAQLPKNDVPKFFVVLFYT